MASIGSFKRGSTFSFYAILKDPQGDPILAELSELSSQVRDNNGNLVAPLVITRDDVMLNKFYFKATDTSSWPVTTLFIDIRHEADGIVQYSATLSVVVEKAVTHE